MRNAINLALLTALALSSSAIGVFAHGGEDDDHPPVTNQLPGIESIKKCGALDAV